MNSLERTYIMQRFSLGLALALFAGVGLMNSWCSAICPVCQGDHVLAIGVIRTGEIMGRNMAEMKKFQTDGRVGLPSGNSNSNSARWSCKTCRNTATIT